MLNKEYPQHDMNLVFEMIEKSGTGEVDVSDIPELQQEAESDDDMVDPSGAEEL